MTFLKKNYEIALVSTEKVKHGLEHDIDSTQETLDCKTFLKFTANFMKTFQFKQMMNVTVCQFAI